ncbi:peptidylarginine deiminase-like enzyme [Acidovorax sp. CF316]|uniref:agmatine deiminase family protein n=1 Tax=Acidovorax sp. CF316 TaxID=1144317 RepID=UPI00026BD414|nr:agmatine deiminase family protein [Acidovorax sp. CF316]EJE50648.1 peptidylarginine deiminase-like enzyme [Acidovorax sp. CF316]
MSNARSPSFKFLIGRAPWTMRSTFESDEFAVGYANFYLCNGAVIPPQFGDARADANARALLRGLFARREVVQLDIDATAAGGGCIHCTTQQQPA